MPINAVPLNTHKRLKQVVKDRKTGGRKGKIQTGIMEKESGKGAKSNGVKQILFRYKG